MKADTHPLYEKLQQFPLDSLDATFPFSRRLRLENGWTDKHTRRALSEYRRFLFLAAVCAHPVSPPDAVDQAWHLHMVYTRSYWDGLCGETLGFPLHHGPTRGGQEESEKFTDWYAKTLASYRVWFGEEPPADIWLSSSERSRKERDRFRRVNVSDNWVIPKRLPRVSPVAALVGGSCLLPLVLGATGRGSVYAALFLILLVTFLGILLACNSATFSARSQKRSYPTGTDAGGHVHVDHAHPDSGGSDGHCDGGGDSGGSDGGSSGCGGGCGGGGD